MCARFGLCLVPDNERLTVGGPGRLIVEMDGEQTADTAASECVAGCVCFVVLELCRVSSI